jgi:hypothetical protein
MSTLLAGAPHPNAEITMVVVETSWTAKLDQVLYQCLSIYG